MKVVVFAIIAAVAGVIGWFAFNPQCAGGTIAASEADCRNIQGFDSAFCQMAFGQEQTAIRNAGNMFATQQECSERHLTCIPFPGQHGWTPKPSGYCLVRGANGALARMAPVYARP